jgi:putative membrane protein
VNAEIGSDQSETFKLMERRLLRYIATPAMIATWAFAILMIIANPDLMSQGWLHAKLLLVIVLSAFHGMSAGWMKKFAADTNTKTQKFFRVANEVPTILLIFIVILAIVKPF